MLFCSSTVTSEARHLLQEGMRHSKRVRKKMHDLHFFNTGVTYTNRSSVAEYGTLHYYWKVIAWINLETDTMLRFDQKRTVALKGRGVYIYYLAIATYHLAIAT